MKRKHLFTDYGTWSRWKISTNSLTILFFRAIPVGEFTAEPPPPVQMSLRLPAARSDTPGSGESVTVTKSEPSMTLFWPKPDTAF